MKILIIGLDGALPERLLDDGHLTHLRWLMEIGCYGKIEGSIQNGIAAARVIGDQLSRASKRLQIIDMSVPFSNKADEMVTQSHQHFQQARDLMQSSEWDCVLILESALTPIQQKENLTSQFHADTIRNYHQHLDTELGKLLESLDNDTVILIVSANDAQSSFILTAPNTPLRGEIERVRLSNLAPTLLELGGEVVSDSMQGNSLLAGTELNMVEESGYSQDEEEIIRERLQGLGYI